VLAALELDAGQLGDALDERRDLGAELRPQLVQLNARVLDDVMEQRGRERGLVELQAGEDLGRAPRVVDELLARLPRLTGVSRVATASRSAGPSSNQLVEARLAPQWVEVLVRAGELDQAVAPLQRLRQVPERSIGLAEPRLGAGQVVEQRFAVLVAVDRFCQL